MATILYNTQTNEEIGYCITNRSMTKTELIECALGIDINNQEDLEKLYDSGADYAYTEDGYYYIDEDIIGIKD